MSLIHFSNCYLFYFYYYLFSFQRFPSKFFNFSRSEASNALLSLLSDVRGELFRAAPPVIYLYVLEGREVIKIKKMIFLLQSLFPIWMHCVSFLLFLSTLQSSVAHNQTKESSIIHWTNYILCSYQEIFISNCSSLTELAIIFLSPVNFPTYNPLIHHSNRQVSYSSLLNVGRKMSRLL